MPFSNDHHPITVELSQIAAVISAETTDFEALILHLTSTANGQHSQVIFSGPVIVSACEFLEQSS